MKVQGARVLIKRLPLPEQTASGLFLLGREYPQIGEVLAVGNGARDKRGVRKPITDLAVGDLVRYERAGLDTREVADDTFIVDYAHCLCGLKPSGAGYRVWALGDFILVRRDRAAVAA